MDLDRGRNGVSNESHEARDTVYKSGHMTELKILVDIHAVGA